MYLKFTKAIKVKLDNFGLHYQYYNIRKNRKPKTLFYSAFEFAPEFETHQQNLCNKKSLS